MWLYLQPHMLRTHHQLCHRYWMHMGIKLKILYKICYINNEYVHQQWICVASNTKHGEAWRALCKEASFRFRKQSYLHLITVPQPWRLSRHHKWHCNNDQQYLSIFPCLPLPSGNLQTPFLSILWCCLPMSPVFLSPLLLSLSLQNCRHHARGSWDMATFSKAKTHHQLIQSQVFYGCCGFGLISVLKPFNTF